MSDSPQFQLQWRGSRKGPLDLPAIKEALKSGDLHSMYQIDVDGEWQTLRDFLEAEYVREKAAAREASKIAKWPAPQRRENSRPQIPMPLRRSARPLDEVIPKYQRVGASRLRRSRHSSTLPNVDGLSVISPGTIDEHDDTPRSHSSSGSGVHSLEWRHIGMALLLLASIVAAGFGSFAIVKVLTTPAVHGRSSSGR